MKQHVNTALGSVLLLSLVVLVAVIAWQENRLINVETVPFSMLPTQPKACTEDAKICSDGSAVGRTGPNCEFAECPKTTGLADKLIVSSPGIGAAISSPVVVTGRARGTWFFEGSFPVEVHDSNGKLIGSAPAQFVPKSAEDTWMTTEFVDFRGEVKFSQPTTSEGYLLFKKDNPSDNRALDESFKLPVKFGKADDVSAWKTYRNKKYGFEFIYPAGWEAPEIKSPCCGMRFESAVAFRKSRTLEENSSGFDVKIYKGLGLDDQRFTDEIASTGDEPTSCEKNSFKSVTVGVDGYQSKEIYILGGDACFREGYFFSIARNGYLFNIVPIPEGGNEYVNYDGKKEVQKSLPEFNQVLSTFKFTK
ncbi:hypothetical protein EPO05_02995 [Patescibacteria group bacterium]|nr:MAG: hypothetical protein EPO05_02995 [Patescibacteria group bacterium]